MRALRLWLMLGTTLAVSGCAGLPEGARPGQAFSDLDLSSSSSLSSPLPLPALPDASVCTAADGSEAVGFSPVAFRAFLSYKIAAEANTEMAQEYVLAVEDMQRTVDALIQAGRLSEEQAQLIFDALERERAEHVQDVWFYRGLVALLLFGVTL